VDSTRDGRSREAEAGEAEAAANDGGGPDNAKPGNDGTAETIRLQLTVRELLL
jgi:hypothetical protein